MIRMLLGYPSRLVCDSLRTTLGNVEGIYVAGCATTAEELHFLLPHGNVVLLGNNLEDASAFEMLNKIRMTHPQTKVLVMGVDDCPDVIIRYIEAGASGYILQNESVVDMVDKLYAAYEEKAIISPSVAAAMMERLSHLANLNTLAALLQAREAQVDKLTSREEEVLHLINKGYTNQEISAHLFIECGTVKSHVHRILKKLDVSSRHEAAYVLQSYQRPAMAA